MLKQWMRHASIVVTTGLVGTIGWGVYQSASAGGTDPVVAPALAGPTVAGVCGNTDMLAGPAEPPLDAVIVSVDADVATNATIQAAVNANPAGTTFYLPDPLYRFHGSVTPRTGDTFIGGPATVIDGGDVATAAFKAGVAFHTPWTMADDVMLQHLTVQHFNARDDQVVVNEDAGDGWTIDHVTIADNHGGAVMMGSHTTITNSCLTRNGQYGFNTYRCRGYDARGCVTSTTVTDLLIDHTEISYNDTERLAATQPGCGCSGGGKFWDVRGARITTNWVHHNNSVGLWADTNDADFLFEGNVIEDNDAAGIMYEISYNARIVGNTFRRNAVGEGTRRLTSSPGDYFPDGAIYISESGGDAAATAAARARGEDWAQVNADQNTLEIADNTFEDNWNGVILWESADRYCSSVANTSTSYCTLYYGSHDHSSANMTACTATPTGEALDQCRWKTKNVDVHNNLFSIDRTAVGYGCADSDDHCGRNAIFSQWGVFPAYPAETVQRAILFAQGNEFHHNVYRGLWRFTAFDQAPTSIRSISTWSAMAPEDAATSYRLWASPADGVGQDSGSVRGPFRPPPTEPPSTVPPPTELTTTVPATTSEPPSTEPATTVPATTSEPPSTEPATTSTVEPTTTTLVEGSTTTTPTDPDTTTTVVPSTTPAETTTTAAVPVLGLDTASGSQPVQ